MTADLIRLWAERDAAKAAWMAFLEEADQYTLENDPVLAALHTPAQERTADQLELIGQHSERHHALLAAIQETERKVRVAAGHGENGDI